LANPGCFVKTRVYRFWRLSNPGTSKLTWKLVYLSPCSVWHSQYLVMYYTMRERWALRSSLAPKCNMFCAKNACPKINPITRVLGHLKTRFQVWKKTGNPSTRKPGSANPTKNQWIKSSLYVYVMNWYKFVLICALHL